MTLDLSTVGFVGLGKMGATMAKHIMGSGRTVVGWDRAADAVASFQATGGIAAGTLPDLAKAPVVFSIVFDDEATREVTLGPNGLVANMKPGAIHVVMASISPTLSRTLAEAHSARGQRYVAASIFGRPEAAAAAELLINCSGDRTAYESMLPILSTMGHARWVGPQPEQAMLLKVMGNTMIIAAVELLREMFAVLRAGGIDESQAKALLVESLFPGPIFSGYAQRYIEQPDQTKKTPIAAKDNKLCLDAAQRLNVDVPLVRFLFENNLP
jgi:3-hydroxyisobutyrate dehydrogenase-like beta-hydroxyacid dehydrogenase